MPCNLPVERGVREAADCKCHGAVMRAYHALNDEPQATAFDAALRIYRYHHPEDSKKDAKLTVERWIHEERMH